MRKASPNPHQGSLLYASLLDQLNPAHPLLKLAKAIPWEYFEQELAPRYSARGKPAKPIRLMVGLSILKHLENLSDKELVERWVQNPYYQAFCGEVEFQWSLPCDPSDLTYFRQRLGKEGFEKVLAVSVALHGERAREEEVSIDTTVQEKNVTFPTDAKLYRKVHGHCLNLARQEGIALSRTYEKEVQELKRQVAYATPKQKRKTLKRATRRLRTIAGRLLREIQRQLPEESQTRHAEDLRLYERVLEQKRHDKNKIYSLHEPHIYCMSKGKEHKPYEFGVKVAIAKTRDSNIIVGATAYAQNLHDNKTLDSVLEQVKRVTSMTPKMALCDRGFRGRQQVGATQVAIPHSGGEQEESVRAEQRRRFRRRAAIEPVIGHLKSDHRLDRNFLAGELGDHVNVLMAAAAFNFRKWLRAILFVLCQWLARLRFWLASPVIPPVCA